MLSVWKSGPAADDPERPALLVVDVSAESEQARGAYNLKLWDTDVKRTTTFGNVSFSSTWPESASP